MGQVVSVQETHAASRSLADVSLADVRAFCRVVDLGSITAAARSLGETKGAVSRRVGRLEEALGLVLLQRAGRQIRPTEDGVAYREKAGQALALLDDAATSLRGQETPSGHLRVTGPPGLGALLLGPILGPFVRQYPEVTVEVLLTEEVLSFSRHRVDVAIRAAGALPDSALVAHKLPPLEPRLYASAGYLAEHGVPERPEDLERHRMLIVPVRGGTMPIALQRGGERVEVTLSGHVTSHDIVLLRDVAVGGGGITVVTTPMTTVEAEDRGLVRVLPEWRVDMGATLYLVTAGGPLPPKIRVFRDFFRERLKELAATCDRRRGSSGPSETLGATEG